jgi:hypothetical protein
MRPKLLGDSYFVPLPRDGLYVRSSHRIVRITDIPIYPWMERIAPYLTGEYTLAELTSSISEDKAKLVRELVRALHDQGVVRDLDADLPHSLSWDEQSAYEAELTYLETYVDSAAHRFQKYRESAIALIGCGLTIEGCVFAALRSGMRHIRVLLTSEHPTDTSRLQEFLRVARERDPAQQLTYTAAPSETAGIDQWAKQLRHVSVALHIAAAPMLGRARSIDRVCLATGTPLIQAVPSGNEVWIGPVTAPAMDGITWESAWRRLSGEACDLTDDPKPSPFFVGTVPSIVANHLVFRCFTHLTGTDEETHHYLLRVALETLETSKHRFHPHPLACTLREEGFLRLQERVEALRRGPAQSDKEFSEVAIKLIDGRAGLFQSVGEEGIEQLPLRVSRVSWKGERPDQAPLETYGYALDFQMARINAMRRAVELRALQDYDERRLQNRLVWAMRLPDYVPVQVASDMIYASTVSVTNSTGVACGRTWDEAVCAGLLQWVEKIAVSHACRSGKALGMVPANLLDVSADVRHLSSLAKLLDSRLSIYDLTGPSGVPTFAFCRGASVICCCSGLSAEAALRVGFERAIYALQMRASGEEIWTSCIEFDLAMTAQGSFELRSLPPVFEASDPLLALCNALAIDGHSLAVALLDHDPHRAALVPYVIRVVAAQNDMASARN